MDGPPPPPMDTAHGAAHAANSPQAIDEPLALVTVKSAAPRKRKAREDGQPAQPRRLTRSHEACARCRRKKSKCDSKHPSCSACLAAGVECVQEDRYRQTLKPRGYTDLLEAQIDKCAALLNKFIPGFKLEYLDYHLSNYGVVHSQPEGQGAQFMAGPYLGAGVDASHLQGGLAEYDPATVPYPAGPAYPVPGREAYDPHAVVDESVLHSAAGPSGAVYPNRGDEQSQPEASGSRPIKKLPKGNDPMANDVSSTSGLIKAFGVTQKIAKDLKPDVATPEDIMGGIPVSRENAFAKPHDPAAWNETPINRGAAFQQQTIVLPRDRAVADQVLTAYFTDLNPYRPIFDELEVREKLEALYLSISPDAEVRAAAATGKYHDIAEDSGFLCCIYLIFALGTLDVQNRRAQQAQRIEESWPTHEQFYDHALGLKPDLQNSISTLQALCALHWYLFTERQGKALWRLVGNMVRLGIELGLHHDPREQGDVFTPEECQLRMRLWLVCLIHDRGTSIIFGRPLAIQRADFNTPAPTRIVHNPEGGGDQIALFSEHFDLGSELLHIQGDVVNSLYRPGRLTGEQVVLRSIEIERSLEQWRRKMPAPYQKLFAGSRGLDRQQKVELVLANVTPDRGLTILKYGTLRMFLLRAVFNNKLVSAHVRHKALHDAVITAHNVLVIHAQLTAYPEVAFFVSPIPIHVAAMIILFASISKVETLAWGLAKEDVSLALKLVPLFRWRSPTTGEAGSAYPLIQRLAVKVYGTMEVVAGPISPPMLLDEMYWLADSILRSDRPPRIEEVWNQPAPGAPDSAPLPVGLGGEDHEQKLSQGEGATLRDQQAQFVAATEQHDTVPATGSAAGAEAGVMDIDGETAPRAGETEDDDYDAEGVQSLLTHLGDQSPTLQSKNPYSLSPEADRHGASGADPSEFFDVWSKRDGAQ